MSSNPPDVFVSYNKNDQRWAEWIAWVLEEAGYEVVIQAWDFRPGGNFVLDMHDALRARRTVAVMSQNYLAAEFTQPEWAAAFREDPRGVKRKLIPMRVADCQLEGLLGPLIYVDLLNVGEAEGRRRVVGAFAKRAKPKKAPSFPAGRVAPSSDVPFPRDLKPEISIAKLPATGDKFVAREAELDRLDAAWADPRTNLVVLVAAGGVGKSSLVNHWLDRMGPDGWRGAERVLGWSFYSQGTEATGASGDAFADYALRWLGYTGDPITSPWEKGQELARRVREARTLLVLDGLEPLQRPPGQQTGLLKDSTLQALLRELQADNDGLCVITTRTMVADIHGRAGVESIDLDALPKEAGAELLRQLGVVGKRAELEAAAEDFGGHALALTLLGTYLRDVCDGDVRRRKEVPLLDEEIEGGMHARSVMRSYETWLGDGPEVQVLRLVGLFDRPAEAKAVEALRAEPITGLTEEFGPGDEARWKQSVARLVKARLISMEKGRLDAHPLVREHFGGRLHEEAPAVWREGHSRLFEHYRKLAPELPETLDAMMALFWAVVHGCRAGREQEALDEVHRPRIRRGDEHFSVHALGAGGTELNALAAYFEQPWIRPSERLSQSARAWVLHETGFALRLLGRLYEAVESTMAAKAQALALGDIGNVASAAVNLSELNLMLGAVEVAVHSAAESVRFADCSEDRFLQVYVRSTLAESLHQSGRLDCSFAMFADAEKMQAELEPQAPLLYALKGHRYCDLLLSRAEPRNGAGLVGVRARYREACEEVRQRASVAAVVAQEKHWVLHIPLDHLSMGRAHLGLALTSPAPNFTIAARYLNEAVEGLRIAGATDFTSRALVARAALFRFEGNLGSAHADLADAEDIATRGHMRLHETDAHLEWTRLHLVTGDLDAAREHLAKARALVDATGYERRRREVDWLTRQLEPI